MTESDSRGAAPHWSAKPLPSWLDAVAYAAFCGVGFAGISYLMFTARAVTFTEPWQHWWGWVVLASFGVPFALFAWFFAPMRTLAETMLAPPDDDDRAARRRFARVRRLAVGSTLAGIPLALALPSWGLSFAVDVTVTTGLVGWWWVPTAALFIPLVAWGARVCSFLPEVTPLWRHRLGLVPRQPAEVSRPVQLLGNVLLSTLGIMVLVSPAALATAVSARQQADALGQWRVVGGERDLVLVNGATLTVPAGWSAYVTTDEMYDRNLGVGQGLSISPDDESIYVSLSVLTSAPPPPLFDPASAAASARRGGTDVLGPESFELGGWRGTVAAWKPRGGARDELLLYARLRSVEGHDVFVLSSFAEGAGVTISDDPEDMLRQVLDILDLAPGEAP